MDVSASTTFSGFIGSAVITSAGEIVRREGREFAIAPIMQLLHETGALLNSGAVGNNASLKKVTGR